MADQVPNGLPQLTVLPAGITTANAKNYTEFFKTHLGPTDTSNWLIPSRLLMSAYPGDQLAAKQTTKLKSFLTAGIDTFVCLQQKNELGRFSPYIAELQQLNTQLQTKLNLSFHNFEIPDNYVASDDPVHDFTNFLVKTFHDGHNILIHCWGGHGRTGTIASIMLGKLYSLEPEKALNIVGVVHKCRENPRSQAPQTRIQINQVKRLLSQHLNLPYEEQEDDSRG